MDAARKPPGLLQGKFIFKKLPNGNLDKTKVVCTFCDAELVYCRSSSSLKYHLNAKHPLANAVDAGPSTDVAPEKSRRQTTLFECNRGKPVSTALSAKLTNLLAQWIATSCRPISVVEDDGLELVLQAATGDPSYKLPARRTIMRRIHDQHTTEKAAKDEKMIEARSVALTGDHWTSVNNGVTVHIIDASWELHSFALGVIKTETRHFAEACARQFLDVANQWGIADKISTIGTDSAPNMVAAGRILPFEHLPCVAHVVQRAIVMSLREGGFDGALAKCRKVVGHFKHSPANSDELNVQQASLGQVQEQLVQDVPTWWNSTLEMIKRVMRNKDALHTTLSQQKHNLALPTNAEYEKLAKLKKLLEPCRYITELLGGDKYVSCSVVLPALCHLQHAMKISDDDPAYIVRFKAAFIKALNQRSEKINLEWLKIHDLRNSSACPEQRGRLELVKGEEPALQPLGEENPEPPKKKTALLLMGSDSESDEETPENNTVERYKVEPSASLDQCPLKWWSEHTAVYGKMAHIARKYLGTPATTVPCERLFSLAGHIVQKRRSRLSSENVNKLVCLSDWWKKEK
ncbi:E3 SUMO-protein ligase ZBED1-like [Xyrauchen texanus]|uniref:E3 SUMO-protein ligase ZBED1-like n=1 Tax=Xyrauchen texanus TaxID=154827 RepID=UPI002242913F|nr:E3 SUMO-protein ligase ZBED1-like [Xyrauchen texanus]